MAKVVTCPSCQAKGSIPDDSKATRIRCPKCSEMFDVKGASAGASSGTMKKSSASAGPKPAAAPRPAFDDLENVAPLPSLSSTGGRRSASPGQAARGQAPGAGQGQSPMLYVVLGVGGLVVLGIGGLLLAVVMRGDGNAARPGAVAAGGTDVAQTAPVQTAQPAVSAPPVVTPTVAPADTSSTSSYSAIDQAEVVRRLKDATVYIKNKIAGKTLASGTGFAIEVRGDNVTVVTNRHVIDLDISELPPKLAPKGSKVELEVVFRSGQGPQKEQPLPAEVLAADSSGDFSNDLAFLLVEGVKQAPTPVNILTKSDTTEGMAYTGAGFPFGGMLTIVNQSKSNPGVTITRGGIARLVRDDHGHLDLFQVDGSLQPGNSGGPIVEEKTGKFIGVVVAKMGAVDTIGFVVPAEEVRQTFAGRVGALLLTLQNIQKTSANLQIKAQIVDPKGNVQGVLIHAAAASAGTVSPKSVGTWPPLPNSTPVELQRDPKVAMASGNVQIALSGEGAAARKVLIQSAHRDTKGKLVYAKPREIELPEKPGRILLSGETLRMLKALERKSLGMLGPLVNGEKDDKLTKDEDNMKIKIEVPGGKIRTLAPLIRTKFNKNKPLHNAPMALIDVEGDFGAIVEVTGDMKPGSTLPKDRQGNDLVFTFQGAGLLLYQDKDNFVRLERTAGVSLASLQPIHKVLFEVVKDGKQVENHVYPPVPEGPVYLRLERRKGRVLCGFSQNLLSPPMLIQQIEVDFAPKLKIGLSAGNISAKKFDATFENFVVINDETKLDALLGEAEPQKKWRKKEGKETSRESKKHKRKQRDHSAGPPTIVNSAVEPGSLISSTLTSRDGRAADCTRSVIECRPTASGVVEPGEPAGTGWSSIQR